MMSEEHKVIKEAQDTLRSYDELKSLREIAVYWVQKNIDMSKSASRSSPERKVSQPSTPTSPGQDEVTSPTLQRWFPLWGGWYNADTNVETDQAGPPQLEEYLQDAIKEDHEVYGVSHKYVLFSHIPINLK